MLRFLGRTMRIPGIKHFDKKDVVKNVGIPSNKALSQIMEGLVKQGPWSPAVKPKSGKTRKCQLRSRCY
jgi:hypothetical protein